MFLGVNIFVPAGIAAEVVNTVFALQRNGLPLGDVSVTNWVLHQDIVSKRGLCFAEGRRTPLRLLFFAYEKAEKKIKKSQQYEYAQWVHKTLFMATIFFPLPVQGPAAATCLSFLQWCCPGSDA